MADQLTRYVATFSAATPSAFADGSKFVTGLATAFEKLGWLARVETPGGAGYIYTNFKVTLSKKNNAPFTTTAAKAAVMQVAIGNQIQPRAYLESAKEIVAFIGESPKTAVSEKGKQQTRDTLNKAGDAARNFASNTICATIEGATGLSCRTVGLIALGVGGLWLWSTSKPIRAAVGFGCPCGGSGSSCNSCDSGVLGALAPTVTKRTNSVVTTTTTIGGRSRKLKRKKSKGRKR